MRARWLGLILLLLPGLVPLPLSAAGADADARAWRETWWAYRHGFISAEGRVIDPMGGISTSEGQAYALFHALVAGDRASFQRLLDWTQQNLAGGALEARLPAWRWGQRPGGDWGVLDANSASDADLWLAYTLIEAGRIWGDLDLARLGHRLLGRIAQEEVTELPGWGPVLLLGRVGSRLDGARYLLNPSYLPLPLLLRLAEVDPGGPWAGLAGRLPELLRLGAPQGLAPDWMVFHAGSRQVEPLPSRRTGSYDAIRTYLWAGLSDPGSPGAAAVLQALHGMAPRVGPDGRVPRSVDTHSGHSEGEGPVGFQAALAPYMARLGPPHPGLQTALRAARRGDGLYGQPAHYYDQNLLLFALGHQSGLYRFDARGRLQLGAPR